MTKLTKSYFKSASKNEREYVANKLGCPATIKALNEALKKDEAKVIQLHDEFVALAKAEKEERDKKAAEEKAAKLAALNEKAEAAKNDEKPKNTKKEKAPKQPEAKLSRKGKTCIVLKQSGKRVAELWIDLEAKSPYCDIWVLTGTNVTTDVTGSQKSERHGNFTQYIFSADKAGRKTARTEFFKIARATKSNIVAIA